MSPFTCFRTTLLRGLGIGLMILSFASPNGQGQSAQNFWGEVKHRATDLQDPLSGRSEWEQRDVHFYRSALSPGILIRMKSQKVRLFNNLDQYHAEGPSFVIIKNGKGTRSLKRGETVSGDEMRASWIVASFQGSQGWEQFDAPWFVALQKRPIQLSLTEKGLLLEFPESDSGYLFSMPLYGYDKLPQRTNDFASRNGLPSSGVQPWDWNDGMPAKVIQRCDWWSRVAKAYPVGFQESFSIDPATDSITFRQDHKWLVYEDDWQTPSLRFAPLSPSLGLAWKLDFPLQTSVAIHDPEYFTAFGPYVGALNVDRLELGMKVLQYTNQLEYLAAPQSMEQSHAEALDLIASGMRDKFTEDWRYTYDHGGRENFCWNIVGDVWYPRGLPFVSQDLKKKAAASLRIYLENDVLKPHSPYHGKYLLHGPGIGSWGEWGDAGKFITNALQTIWAYGQYTEDWDLIRQRWDLIKKFFVTPEEADWLSFGRRAIAEIGDEAAPCSAYARMAWALHDLDEYLYGVQMFARELVHLYIKQKGGDYFYRHQPYNEYRAMPRRIYPTDLWGSTRGWQVDGPTWGKRSSGEHQSANRWMRFHDPDVGRMYRDLLAKDVQEELEWYSKAAFQEEETMYRQKAYRDWLRRDNPHTLTGLGRLRSFLLGEPYEQLQQKIDLANYAKGWPAARIATGYAYLRSMTPVRHLSLVPRDLPRSPFVIGLQRRGPQDTQSAAQAIWKWGISLEPRWMGWEMPQKARSGEPANRSFGEITGDFGRSVTGAQGNQWISNGCSVYWADALEPRELPNSASVLARQENTPIVLIGPFSNARDSEITDVVYPPERQIDLKSTYEGLNATIEWKTATLGADRRLNLRRYLFENGQSSRGSLAYALQYVWSPKPMDAYLLVGHQGGVVAWVNGIQAVKIHGKHKTFQPDAEQGLIHLEKGWNSLLVKTEAYNQQFELQFRIVHLDRQPVPDLRFAASPGL